MLVAAAACHGAAMEVRVWRGTCCCGCGGVDDDSAVSESSCFSASLRPSVGIFWGIVGQRSLDRVLRRLSLSLYSAPQEGAYS